MVKLLMKMDGRDNMKLESNLKGQNKILKHKGLITTLPKSNLMINIEHTLCIYSLDN